MKNLNFALRKYLFAFIFHHENLENLRTHLSQVHLEKRKMEKGKIFVKLF